MPTDTIYKGHTVNKAFPLGDELTPQIVMDLNGLSPNDIGVEVLFINKGEGNNGKIIFKHELVPTETKSKHVTFSNNIPIMQSGVFDYGFRIYPKHPLLPHRQDFALLKWV